MSRPNLWTLLVFCLINAAMPVSASANDDTELLQGVWQAKSIEADGKSAPEEAANKMRFTFKGDVLLIKGNRGDEEEECAYKIDTKESPKHINVKPKKEKEEVQGIFEIKDDELKVCFRHASSKEGRPAEFVSKPDSKLVLIIFKKQKP